MPLVYKVLCWIMHIDINMNYMETLLTQWKSGWEDIHINYKLCNYSIGRIMVTLSLGYKQRKVHSDRLNLGKQLI